MRDSIGREIVGTRIAGATFWNIIFHLVIFKCFVFIINFSLFSPFSWFKSVTYSFIALETWLYLIPLVLVTFVQGVVSCKEYLIPPVPVETRFHNFRQLFNVHNIIIGFMYAFIGFFIPLIYSSTLEDGYNSFNIQCEKSSCMSENRLFIIFGGIWSAVYYFIHNHLLKIRRLSFPYVLQRKVLVVKGSIFPSFKYAMKYTTVPILSFLMFYYLKGGSLRDTVSSTFGMKAFPGDVDSILHLFVFKRLFYLWLFSTVIIFTLRMMEVMIKLCLTQRHEFPMYAIPSRPHCHMLLEEALVKNDVPIVKHLGFLDLVLVSETDPVRRREIFTLSQPGGHPYTWNSIRKECVYTICSFTQSFTLALQLSAPKCSQPVDVPKPNVSRYESAVYFKSSSDSYPLFCTETLTAIVRTLRAIVLEWIMNKWAVLMDSRVMRYLFGPVPEYKVNFMLLHSLPVVWAVESLSFLACYSLSEDEYGIVQNDIPQIVNSMLSLKNCLDSLSKNTSMIKKGFRFDEATQKMHNTLYSATKKSLCNIAVKFRPFLQDLQLPPEDEKQLSAIMYFRE